MAAQPTPIPEARSHRHTDFDNGGTADAPPRSSFSAWRPSALPSAGPRSPGSYFSSHSATFATQWSHARTTSLGAPLAGTQASAQASSAPDPSPNAARPRGQTWISLPRNNDGAKFRDSVTLGASQGSPFTSLYRQLSTGRARQASMPVPKPTMAGEGSSGTSCESTLSESLPSTPPRSQQPMPAEPFRSRSYAERMEHLDADGMWPQRLSSALPELAEPTAMNKESAPIIAEPTAPGVENGGFRRSLQRRLSIDTKRKPSPMSERLLMGHLDTQ
ncbi:hypothetical protein MSPP1_001343 [Malassezia sp. CBS 17886]|nr:hypothetical protein MSPP1_001343 [Malassezia sp. CBS 17886]